MAAFSGQGSARGQAAPSPLPGHAGLESSKLESSLRG